MRKQARAWVTTGGAANGRQAISACARYCLAVLIGWLLIPLTAHYMLNKCPAASSALPPHICSAWMLSARLKPKPTNCSITDSGNETAPAEPGWAAAAAGGRGDAATAGEAAGGADCWAAGRAGCAAAAAEWDALCAAAAAARF